MFIGTLVESNHFSITISFTSVHNADVWTLVSVYGPCQGPMRDEFVQWLYDLNIPDGDNWLLLGDFNFIRSLENRNRPGGDLNDIFLFNEIIGHLGILELPLKGRAFTWSNMQDEPLLEQLDWLFTSSSWISVYPNTIVLPMAKTSSDHVPCIVSIDTDIPKSNRFRFENYWAELPGFLDCVQNSWNAPIDADSAASILSKKFKRLRYALKKWSFNMASLKKVILSAHRWC